jgi:hypothetical protein
MDCPICGGEIPAGGEVCPTCGEDTDESFLKEAFADLTNGGQEAVPAAKPARQRSEPSALKPARRLDWRGILGLAGAVTVVVILIVIAILIIPGGSKVAFSEPEQAVKAYYEALSRGDLEGMLSLMAEAFKPTETYRTGLEKALLENTYKVSDLTVKVIDKDERNSDLSIDNVVVTITPKKGGSPVTHSLVDEILQPARNDNPDAVMLVNSDFYDSTWKIASRPYNGWSADNIWALGRPQVPAP